MPRRHAPGPDELDADLFTEPLDADLLADDPALASPQTDAPSPGASHASRTAQNDGSSHAITPELTSSLDLHHFVPRECADVVAEYLHAAQAAGFPSVRIIHGKGTGALRRTVHVALDRHPAVRAYRLADDQSSWGATLVELVPAQR